MRYSLYNIKSNSKHKAVFSNFYSFTNYSKTFRVIYYIYSDAYRTNLYLTTWL